jgi:hypothetical protein
LSTNSPLKDCSKLMGHRIRRALALPWQDRWDLARAWLLLLVTDVGLRVLPFRQVQRLLSPDSRRNSDTPVSPQSIERLTFIVNTAARHHLYEMSCLRKSLVLQRMLGECGIATELQFGVNRDSPDTLGAHAWLEYEGRVIGEPQSLSARFAPLKAQETH